MMEEIAMSAKSKSNNKPQRPCPDDASNETPLLELRGVHVVILWEPKLLVSKTMYMLSLMLT